MGKTNGKTEMQNAGIDLEHELPPAENNDDSRPASASQTSVGTIANGTSEMSAELEKVKAERDSLLDRLARAQAEFENARRRATKEQQEYRDFAISDAIKSLLPVIDSFERALRVKSDSKDFRNGIELIYKQLQDAFAKLGVRAVPAQGEPFDPHYHEAIEMVETTDAPDHHVIEELQRGYKLKDRLLRPAMVRVAKNPGK
jgi:molecular chaperone GrpE